MEVMINACFTSEAECGMHEGAQVLLHVSVSALVCWTCQRSPLRERPWMYVCSVI